MTLIIEIAAGILLAMFVVWTIPRLNRYASKNELRRLARTNLLCELVPLKTASSMGGYSENGEWVWLNDEQIKKIENEIARVEQDIERRATLIKKLEKK